MTFSKSYFDRYRQRNLFNLERGERPFLYAYWMRQLSNYIEIGDPVLDVGCGCGYFLKRLEKRYRVYGTDVSQDSLRIAGTKTKAQLKCCSAEHIGFPDQSFAALFAFDVVEHLDEPGAFFEEAQRLLRPSGYMILSTPNPDSLGNIMKGKQPRRTGVPYDERRDEWHGWRDDTHISVKSKSQWRRLLNEKGFRIVRDGTDTLWDVPYTSKVPVIIQKAFLTSSHWALVWLFGFFPWKFGENYICIARKH